MLSLSHAGRKVNYVERVCFYITQFQWSIFRKNHLSKSFVKTKMRATFNWAVKVVLLCYIIACGVTPTFLE